MFLRAPISTTARPESHRSSLLHSLRVIRSPGVKTHGMVQKRWLYTAAACLVLFFWRSADWSAPSPTLRLRLERPTAERPTEPTELTVPPEVKVNEAFEQIRLARVPPAEELLTPPFAALPAARAPAENNGRTLVIVAFERSPRSTKNVEFLLQQVVGGPRAQEMDFIFVDTSREGPFRCFPDLPNVHYVHRPRVGLDICSYKTGLAIVPPGLYKYVVLMNGSVRGPFSHSSDFLKPFKDQLNARTPVVGTSVNCGPRLHVQSMFFMLNSVGTELMNATLSCDIPHHGAAMRGPHGELNMSSNVLQAGYNLGATQLMWRHQDVTNNTVVRRTCYYVGSDPYAPGRDRDPITLKTKARSPEPVHSVLVPF
ncbi:unnamed protein product [Durusdinium trenchii]|uniref:Uncharacterized protein n=1 Tax=Durusdinium trenchii TaxID=1381693 RepID=A0ABP0RFG5_9DINO